MLGPDDCGQEELGVVEVGGSVQDILYEKENLFNKSRKGKDI